MPDRELPLFPLNVVLFPGMRLPLHIFEDRYKLMIGTCMVTDQTFGVALIKSGEEVGGPAETYPVGTTARILEIDRLPAGRLNLVALGVERFRLIERLDGQVYALGRVELLVDAPESPPEGLTARVARQFRRYLTSKGAAADQVEAISLPVEPASLSYLVAATLGVPVRERQKLLEADSAELRLRRELAMLEWLAGGGPDPDVRSFSVN
jgi:uncharacterized protein